MSTALLLMDIQTGILDRIDGVEEYLDAVVATQVKAEEAGLPVILVRVGFNLGHPEVSAHNRVFSGLKESGDLVLGDASTEPHARLLRGHGEIVVTKKRISAFVGSDLALVLRAHDIDHLVLAGVSTSGVVLSTVRAAADLDFSLTVLADLCRDHDDEVHRVLIEKVFPRQAEVIDSADWDPRGQARYDPG